MGEGTGTLLKVLHEPPVKANDFRWLAQVAARDQNGGWDRESGKFNLDNTGA